MTRRTLCALRTKLAQEPIVARDPPTGLPAFNFSRLQQFSPVRHARGGRGLPAHNDIEGHHRPLARRDGEPTRLAGPGDRRGVGPMLYYPKTSPLQQTAGAVLGASAAWPTSRLSSKPRPRHRRLYEPGATRPKLQRAVTRPRASRSAGAVFAQGGRLQRDDLPIAFSTGHRFLASA